MEKYIFMILGIILGIAISLFYYGDRKEKTIKKLNEEQKLFSTKKLDIALEKAVDEMQEKMKIWNRALTEEEKNRIIFSYLNKEDTINL